MKILLPLLLVTNMVCLERSGEDRSPSPMPPKVCDTLLESSRCSRPKVIVASCLTLSVAVAIVILVYKFK